MERRKAKPNIFCLVDIYQNELFVRCDEDLPTCDLLVVAGTSLVVSPANSLVYRVPEHTVRVIINNEPVGEEFGIDYGPKPARDYFANGYSDEVFLDLIEELGWLDDLKSHMDDLPPKSTDLIQSR